MEVSSFEPSTPFDRPRNLGREQAADQAREWINARIANNSAVYRQQGNPARTTSFYRENISRAYTYDDSGYELTATYTESTGQNVITSFYTRNWQFSPASAAKLRFCSAVPGAIEVLDQDVDDRNQHANVIARLSFQRSALTNELIAAGLISESDAPLPASREYEVSLRRLDTGDWRLDSE
jgi:hypothetical protein